MTSELTTKIESALSGTERIEGPEIRPGSKIRTRSLLKSGVIPDSKRIRIVEAHITFPLAFIHHKKICLAFRNLHLYALSLFVVQLGICTSHGTFTPLPRFHVI